MSGALSMIKSELVTILADANPHLYQRDVERIVNTERMINARLGIDRRHDTLPKRFLEEPAGPANSPSAGSVVELERMLDEYYAARGWALDTGLPTGDKLRELEIGG